MWCRDKFHTDEIDFKYIDSIGISYSRYKAIYGEKYAESELQNLIALLSKYGYDLPIYDNFTFKLLSEPSKDYVLKK